MYSLTGASSPDSSVVVIYCSRTICKPPQSKAQLKHKNTFVGSTSIIIESVGVFLLCWCLLDQWELGFKLAYERVFSNIKSTDFSVYFSVHFHIILYTHSYSVCVFEGKLLNILICLISNFNDVLQVILIHRFKDLNP